MDTAVENKTNNIAVAGAPVRADAKPVAPIAGKPAFNPGVRGPRPFGTFGRSPGGDRSKNPRKSFGGRGERVKPEFDQKILNIRRVTRVTKGGKRLSFSVATVAGNRKGSIGVGTGKAGDTSLAIDKAYRSAKKNMMHLALTKTMSIPHDVSAKYCSGRVLIMPAPGRGVSAGSAVRSILELAGIKDVTAKIISPSKNKLNIARASIEALKIFSRKGGAVQPVTTQVKVPFVNKVEVKKEIKK
ncbi:MAG: 30S ribosomal protein S5 [Candidatus Paceibacterota bacterium]|jgi:small subunit ribosomal protein S5